MQPALVQTEAVLPLAHPRQQAKSRVGAEEYQTMLAHELELERLQQGFAADPAHLVLFRGDSRNLFHYLSLLGTPAGPSEIHMLSYRHAFTPATTPTCSNTPSRP